MNIPAIYTQSFPSQPRYYITQGPVIYGQQLSSGQFFSGNWALLEKNNRYFIEYLGTSGVAFSNNLTGLNIQRGNNVNFISMTFNNSGLPIVAEEDSGLTKIKYLNGPEYSFYLNEPILMNTVSFNQPYTGVDISGLIFRTGEVICFGRNGDDLVGYFERENFASGRVLNSGILNGKTLKYGCFNQRHFQSRDYHPYTFIFFAESLSGVYALETKYQTRLGHYLFDEYSTPSSGTGLFLGGWGNVGTDSNSLNNVCFSTQMVGFYAHYYLTGTTGFKDGEFYTGINEIRNLRNLTEQPYYFKTNSSGFYAHYLMSGAVDYLNDEFYTGVNEVTNLRNQSINPYYFKSDRLIDSPIYFRNRPSGSGIKLGDIIVKHTDALGNVTKEESSSIELPVGEYAIRYERGASRAYAGANWQFDVPYGLYFLYESGRPDILDIDAISYSSGTSFFGGSSIEYYVVSYGNGYAGGPFGYTTQTGLEFNCSGYFIMRFYNQTRQRFYILNSDGGATGDNEAGNPNPTFGIFKLD